MTLDDAIHELTAVAAARRKLDKAVAALNEREHAAIQAAWRAHIPPTEIAAKVERSAAHVRKLRPEDVPPARLGGGASEKARRQHGQADTDQQ